MKKLFLIIGAPGSGKTTNAAMIAERNNELIAHYSTGDLLRAEVASGSDRGHIIDSFISKGLIVPIEIAIETITGAIKSSPFNVILFDGYPRSHEQMYELDKFLTLDSSIELISVIEVVVSEGVARDRVLGRARGADDDERVFNNRMSVYTDPLSDIQSFYESKRLLHKIDGERPIDAIVNDMESFIKYKIQVNRK
ncbi:adenylate kinase [Sulfuricurvum sp.]|uniref:adenylate kinase n=1 Tax=Sulfuricurvum sp. TaxID=2025608 RepID=UPI0019BA1494|nr:adenylate kinase [Sulfuricurvum sp.]MBD3798316.1 adenylate kinase [Campylobacterota bacterium]MBD3806680.1 adenylate kinase [Sulfuricurvum sp.]